MSLDPIKTPDTPNKESCSRIQQTKSAMNAVSFKHSAEIKGTGKKQPQFIGAHPPDQTLAAQTEVNASRLLQPSPIELARSPVATQRRLANCTQTIDGKKIAPLFHRKRTKRGKMVSVFRRVQLRLWLDCPPLLRLPLDSAVINCSW